VARRAPVEAARVSESPTDIKEQYGILAALVDSSNDLLAEHWLRLYERACALSAQPDLLLQVGRGCGDSTVVLTRAANWLGARFVSVRFDGPPAFETVTCPNSCLWSAKSGESTLVVVQADVREYTRPTCERCFLFWDALGTDVAETMLNRVIPALPRGVVVHDIRTVAEVERSPRPLREYRFRWREFVSAFAELALLGAWLDERGPACEQGTGMLSFARPADRTLTFGYPQEADL